MSRIIKTKCNRFAKMSNLLQKDCDLKGVKRAKIKYKINMNIKKINLAILTVLFSTIIVSSAFASVTDGTINSTYKYAWSEKIGWINFGASGGDVHVTASALTGSAWNETYGWIKLNATTTGTGRVTNNGEGDLSGYAWGDNVGWVDFSSVAINDSGVFSGTASGTITGQISFDCSNCQVRTDWRPQCNNGLDDDSDSLFDYPNDPGCVSAGDNSESSDVKLTGSGGGGFFAPLTALVESKPVTFIKETIKETFEKIKGVIGPLLPKFLRPSEPSAQEQTQEQEQEGGAGEEEIIQEEVKKEAVKKEESSASESIEGSSPIQAIKDFAKKFILKAVSIAQESIKAVTNLLKTLISKIKIW